jgi:hypothetical protein
VFFGEDGGDMLRVAECESNLDPKNVTPPHSASGLFQFLPSTWKTTPYADRSVLILKRTPTPPPGCGRSAAAVSGSASSGLHRPAHARQTPLSHDSG